MSPRPSPTSPTAAAIAAADRPSLPISLLDYPSDIVLSILKHLPANDLVQLRPVSKTLAKLVLESPCLWRRVNISFRQYWQHWSGVLSLLTNQSKYIRHLTLNNVRDDVIHAHLPLLQGLESLTLNDWLTLSDLAFRSLKPPIDPDMPPALSFPRLRQFTLVHLSSSYCAVGASALTNLVRGSPMLEEVHIWCNVQLSAAFTRHLPVVCPRVRVLSLSSMQWQTEHDLAAMFAGLNNLEYLAMSMFQLDNAGLARLAVCAPRLRTLSIHGTGQISDSGMRELATRCKDLRTVKLFDCPNVSLGIMDDLGFESVLVTSDIRHGPCFKYGMGMGFVRMRPMVKSHSVLSLVTQDDGQLAASSAVASAQDMAVESALNVASPTSSIQVIA
ncbi:hypothetical protein BCR44DRAFT_1284482 [Catenaria anguillulae PL171]|uniref:F-box domain-containing protein n=1 Tax=Catenaria anguillulae PL171 TaxID=765915 RepID=A0A1Y2HYB3_9FUNG|nr:hypothetical protein BCR44DRAFT_1284482 [Catenaria anguillulae PL171]